MLEYAIVVERAVGVRWLQAERLLAALPSLGAPPHQLAVQRGSSLVIALLHFSKLAPDVEARLTFWCRHLGAGLLAISEADLGERANFRLQIECCDFKSPELTAAKLPGQLAALRDMLGMREAQSAPLAEGLRLTLDVIDPAVTATPRGVFLATEHPLPLGDRLVVELKTPREKERGSFDAQVTYARTSRQAKPGFPAGFELKVPSIPERVRRALEDAEVARAKAAAAPAEPAAQVTARPRPTGPGGAERRAAPRYRVRAPVNVAAPAEIAELEYESGDALAADYVANLSIGGAFIRSARPPPLHTKVQLRIGLPSGESLTVDATVVNVLAAGMGVQFQPTPETKARLEAEIAALAVRRSALVVDDDALALRMVSDALKARGFSVTSAHSGDEALRQLLDRLPDFDVLVTDLTMPGRSGRELIKLIRVDGGERDLVIVVYGGDPQALEGLEGQLAIDATVRKGPSGPGEVADAAYRLLEARRPPPPAARTDVPYRVKLGSAEEVAAEAECLRMGGVFVQTSEPLELEEELRVDVEFPGGDLLTVSGTVVAVQQNGAGVQLDLDPEQSRAWLGLVDRHARRMPRSSDQAHDRLLRRAPAGGAPKGQRLGRYELLSLLGTGGMAEVFYARAVEGPRAGQPVAIKRLLPALAGDAASVELFTAEADLLRLLEHPNIVRTYDVGATNDTYYLVMECIDGRDLGQLLRRCGTKGIALPVDFAVYLACVVLDALEYAHHAKGLSGRPLNIVHSDVSPSNVFISRSGEIKLGDFGVAQVAGTHATRVFGKLSYLSPDAIEGDVDISTDVWASAVCLYEMLTLQKPFQGEDEESLFKAIRGAKLTPVRELRPDLPAGLCDVVHQALAKQKKKRFASAAQLRAALEPHFNPNVGTPLAIAAVVRGLFDAPGP